MHKRLHVLALLVPLVPAGCGGNPSDRGEPTAEVVQAVKPLTDAPCTIMVKKKPSPELTERDLEGDYLPHVVMCEDGGAGPEALKAQAIAARSVAYYAIKTKGSICDGSGCQVYGCSANPTAKVRQAVKDTEG